MSREQCKFTFILSFPLIFTPNHCCCDGMWVPCVAAAFQNGSFEICVDYWREIFNFGGEL